MKKQISILAILLVFAMLFSACDLFPTDNPETTTTTTTKGEDDPVNLSEISIYLVGDSTVASFSDDYIYPRYGYGTQLKNYLYEAARVKNLALSGRSSKSFLSEANYTTLKNGLKEGDILIIGFGHNDEKSDDATRFTDASKPYTDPSSFGYHLYEYYIKLAQSVGATPILCTPIVRAATDDDYSDSEGHNTTTGDYAQAIRDLGTAVGVDVIDLTALTRARYESIGFEEASYYHAVLQGKYGADGTTVVPNWDSLDKTHLNIYGAKYVAYLIASELKKIDGIGDYVCSGIAEPTKEADLVSNPDYVVVDYAAPDLENYQPKDHFTTITDGWYGTAFGSTGGSALSASSGFIAKETSQGVFSVGQDKDVSGSEKGKIASAEDGFAFVFRQVEASKNFTLTVSGRIVKTTSKNQSAFGLMLRDDCLINVSDGAGVSSNYVTAGLLWNSDGTASANFYRENASLKKGKESIKDVATEDIFTMTIERIGQVVNVTVVYNGQTYTATHTDFDFFARDTGYMYVGMFANRGTVVEFTNVQFEITGDSQGA